MEEDVFYHVLLQCLIRLKFELSAMGTGSVVPVRSVESNISSG